MNSTAVGLTWNCPLTVLEGPCCLVEAALASECSSRGSFSGFISLWRGEEEEEKERKEEEEEYEKRG